MIRYLYAPFGIPKHPSTTLRTVSNSGESPGMLQLATLIFRWCLFVSIHFLVVPIEFVTPYSCTFRIMEMKGLNPR